MATLGFPTITELILEPPSDPRPQERSKPRRERPTDEEQRSGKERRRRSSHEPGDESEQTGWMQGLSSRLSAYSLSGDGAGPVEDDDEEPAETES
jgi:hypothetical protein